MSIYERPLVKELEDAETQNELRLRAQSMVRENWMMLWEINEEFQFDLHRSTFSDMMKRLGVKGLSRTQQYKKYRKSDYIVGSRRFGSKLRKWKAMGHVFGVQLVCQRCVGGVTWSDHQANPVRCAGNLSKGVSGKPYVGKYTVEERALMLKMRKDGVKSDAIGQEFGCSGSYVRKLTNRALLG